MTNMKPMIAVDLSVLGRVIVLGLMTFGLASCSYDRYLPPGDTGFTQLKQPPQVRNGNDTIVANLPDYSNYYKGLDHTLVMVQPGDTLSKIAQRYDVPTPAVIALNGSVPPYTIQVGQQIKIPYFKIHSVRAGETLYAISQVYNVETENVAHFNNLMSPYSLRPGNILKIPQNGGGETLVASTKMATWKPEQRTPQLQREQMILTPPKATRTNRDLKVVTLKAPSVQTNNVPAIRKADPIKPVVILGGTAIAKVDLPPLPKSRYSIKQPPLRSGKSFDWPVKGKVLSAYGRKKNGFHNDGINIKVKPGTPVRAAENGIVSYVGNEMRSFGNLILISHSDGYVTTYGHNAEILVQKGDLVRRGDMIARAGATGDVAVAQLHFEIRKEGAALNPRRLLARN
ncbi:MAG: peptidoglycan DD-metalloendopeptidase family protein [Sneathiella sp.]|nr:peptidoglycan DD-metalloendopeptidase family protein [Sneathiella sp.]